jgi:hypothetical protein
MSQNTSRPIFSRPGSSSRWRTVAALSLTATLTLATPAVWAGGAFSSVPDRVPGEAALSVFAQGWTWIMSLWSADTTDPGPVPDHRCTIDPDGTGCPVPSPAGQPGPANAHGWT